VCPALVAAVMVRGHKSGISKEPSDRFNIHSLKHLKYYSQKNKYKMTMINKIVYKAIDFFSIAVISVSILITLYGIMFNGIIRDTIIKVIQFG
jgi:hypothetical protein